jgi:transcriptional regulator with XRE-family HTH domain
MSQSALAESIGLTFQQVQKYEKGTNRVGAGRLRQISLALGVPISFFYEGAPADAGWPAGEQSESSEVLSSLLSQPDGLRLMRAFAAIERAELRMRLVEMAETMAALSAEERGRSVRLASG